MMKKVNLNNYSDFIFDFDGVIVDSVGVKTDAFAEIYKNYGEEIVSKVIEHHLSHGGIDRFKKFIFYHKKFLNKDLSKERLNTLGKKFSILVLNKVLKVPFIKGSLKFLKLLREKEKNLFLISATPEKEFKRIVVKRKLKKYFMDIKGAPLSKKENLAFIIKKYNLKPKECVYFGDSKQDKQAADFFDFNFVPVNYYREKIGFRDFTFLMNNKKPK